MIGYGIRCYILFVAAVALSLFPGDSTDAQTVRVEVENLQPADGFYFTPVWVGFHDGSFDYFDAGTSASGSLEALAEGGDFSGISADFAGSGTDGAVFAPGGFSGAPVFDPGEVAAEIFNLNAGERFFSFGSMIIPSNDAFIGNDSGTAYELFDVNGNFNGTFTIDIVGADIWDAGTEVNDGLGAAFSATGGTSTTENGVVMVHPGLDNFLGTDTAAGTTIGSIPGPTTPIARLTITSVPEPGSMGLLASLAGGAAFAGRRRRSVGSGA